MNLLKIPIMIKIRKNDECLEDRWLKFNDASKSQ